MKKKLYIIACVLFFCISATLLRVYIYEAKNSDKLLEGIYIGQFHVGGLTQVEAREKLKAYVDEHLKNPITLQYFDKSWKIIPYEMVEIQIEKTLDDVISAGKSKNFLLRYFTRLKLRTNPKKFDLEIRVNDEAFQKTLRSISDEIDREPKNAEFKIADGNVTIEKEEDGVKVDGENLKAEILKNLWSKERKISVPVITLKPEITQETLAKMNINEEIVSFSTKFDKSQIERTTNIKLAAEKLKNYIIPPGQVFSFNDAVGERTREHGYKEAPIFANNEVTTGIGGGVCQLSTTLYNLALLADLEIVERSNHSLPVSYVPLGRDATVNFGVIDFKFKNTTGEYLLLHTEIKDNTLTMRFYGSKKIDKKVDVVSEIEKVIPPPVNFKEDPSLEKGKIIIREGKPGYQVKVWKVITYSNGVQEKKLISTDIYNPIASIIYIGKKDE
ncbi:MAG: VanW family protein [Bacillota bacterium]|nr:MAG: hypothetical protein DIU66_01985 [Bacillota bacterium]